MGLSTVKEVDCGTGKESQQEKKKKRIFLFVLYETSKTYSEIAWK